MGQLPMPRSSCMNITVPMIVPELILSGVACVLFLVGCSTRAHFRRITPYLALIALLAVVVALLASPEVGWGDLPTRSLRTDSLSLYIRVLSSLVAIMLLLLAWPTNANQTGNSALHFGHDAGEFFALFLLSITGLLLTSIANDLIILFLALELVSIPTYIM